jgi:hypothetical protein
MSAVLFREGNDLDELLAELDEEYPHGVRVVDVRYDREGGVLGFFARRKVAVSYTPVDPDPAPAAPSPAPAAEPVQDEHAEFARMLLEMAAEKAAQRSREDEPVTDPFDIYAANAAKHAAPEPAEPEFEPQFERQFQPPVAPPAEPTLVVNGAAPAPAERPQLRRRLLDLGIPVGWLPDSVDDAVVSIRAAVAHVPAARPPQSPDFVLIVAGPGPLALETARQVHQRLGVRRPIRTVNIAGADAEELRDGRQASWLAADVRLGEGGPAVVAVGLDEPSGSGWDDDGPRRIVDRLQPDAVWGVADARWRASDVRVLVGQLHRTDALAIVHADRTGSPAALWELNLPVALLDGRPATPAAWTALLLDRLDALG